MKAAIYEKYGSADVVEIKDVARPEIGENEVLVMVYATTVTTADWRFRASDFPAAFWLPGRLMAGLFAPKKKILGHEFAGRVVSVGETVTRFKLGDEVFGFSDGGAHAEYLAIGEDAAITRKPANIAYDGAAAVPFGALSALVFLRDFGKLRQGQRVLVNGASGAVGSYAVQLAKHFGAEVTGITSTGNVDLVRSLGATRVIDYSREDFTRDGAVYDLVFDTVGKISVARAKTVLKDGGVFIPLVFGLTEVVQSLVSSVFGRRKVVIGVSGDTKEDLEFIRKLLETGELRPVIDGHYPLERIADAHRRVESGHKVGAAVVTVVEAASLHRAA